MNSNLIGRDPRIALETEQRDSQSRFTILMRELTRTVTVRKRGSCPTGYKTRRGALSLDTPDKSGILRNDAFVGVSILLSRDA